MAMLISFNWLRELLPDLSVLPEEVAAALTTHSFETKIVRRVRIDPKILVARVIKVESHPKADRLKLVTVDAGGERTTVVCGADNVREGVVAPFSPIGTVLMDKEGQPFTLASAKIRGIESRGMLNSPRELGLGDWHGGIYLLPEETSVGTPLAQHILDDVVLEAEVTPNRAHDCLCQRGIARELAAILGLVVREAPVLEVAMTDGLGSWSVTVEDSNDCRRYLGVLMTGVKVKPSPLWLQARIWAMGGRPINNVVDITNYAMFEAGNPTHAFDAKKLTGNDILVRRGNIGESIIGLDDIDYGVSPEDLLVTSGGEPVALAGILGGRGTEVSDDTTEILLEAANFRSYLIQETSSRLKIDSESATRFRKELSPCLAEAGAGRVAKLLADLAGAQAVGAVQVYPRRGGQGLINFSTREVERISGLKLSSDEIVAVLERLRCQVKREGDKWAVLIPEERLDLTGPHDLVEEIIRLIGLEKIAAVEPRRSKEGILLSESVQWRELVRDFLVGQGLIELLNLSFDDEAIINLVNISDKAAHQGEPRMDIGGFKTVLSGLNSRIGISNPPSPERKYLRQCLWLSLVGNLLANKAELSRKTASGRAMFEIGQVFFAGSGGQVAGIREEEHVAGVLMGVGALGRARDVVEQIVRLFGTTNDGYRFGRAQELPAASKVVQKLKQPVAFFELNLNLLIQRAEVAPAFTLTTDQEVKQYAAPSKYPAAYRDLSILVDKSVSADKGQEIIERIGGELVADVDLKNIYQPAGADKQGLAWHITYQSREKTLTDEEVDMLHNNIVAQLKEELDADLRE